MPTPSVRACVIDEYGDLARQIALFRPIVERHKQLKAEIESWHEGFLADRSYEHAGTRYQLQVGPREWVRRIVKMEGVYKLLGKERFLRFCSFPLKHIDANLTESEQAKVVERERTGSRDVRAVALELKKAA